MTTAMLRNDTKSSSIDSSTTAAMRSGIRCEMFAVLSMDTAVAPPTCTTASLPAIGAGVLRSGGGRDDHDRGVTDRVELDGADCGHSGGGSQRSGDSVSGNYCA